MKSLIDRNALIAEYDRVHVGEPGQARKLMEEAPEVDAVPVELIQKRIDALKEVADAEFELNGGYVGSAFSLVCSLEGLLREWAERRTDE